MIKQLPPSVINKIAAGEVIERPASAVKELVENAIDASATRIDISVEQGGMSLMRVSDNGKGIPAEELTLAVASHATSKISDADDLFRVATLGFRGEALASIAEVSQFRLRSRVSDSTAGAELEVYGGKREDIAPCGCPVGTVVEIRNLFFNTPVRRKFLRTTQTEMGHVSEACTRLALAHPQIHFTLAHNERPIFDLPPVGKWQERIRGFFGDEIAESLIWIESNDDCSRLSGFVADPRVSRSNNRMQYLFLNGRFIRDRALQHALTEAYRGLLMTGRFPIAFLRLKLDPAAVDVNVHPTKMEVRFQDGGRLYSQMLGTLRSKFLSTDLTERVQEHTASETTLPGSVLAAEDMAEHRNQVTDWARGTSRASEAPAQQSSLELQYEPRPSLPEFKPFRDSNQHSFGSPSVAVAQTQPSTARPATVPDGPLEDRSLASPSPQPAATADFGVTRASGVQIHNRYLVTEHEDGMMVIDQHALHERILYEQFREKVLKGQLETQRLLVPETVNLTAAETAAALDARDTLRKLGLEIEPFGGDTVLVSSYPAMLSNLSPGEALRQVIDILISGGKSPEARDVLDELLHMMSCKAAIKAGDRLSPAEIDSLLEQREQFQDSHHCPHGRPTALVFSREELDRKFKRI